MIERPRGVELTLQRNSEEGREVCEASDAEVSFPNTGPSACMRSSRAERTLLTKFTRLAGTLMTRPNECIAYRTIVVIADCIRRIVKLVLQDICGLFRYYVRIERCYYVPLLPMCTGCHEAGRAVAEARIRNEVSGMFTACCTVISK